MYTNTLLPTTLLQICIVAQLVEVTQELHVKVVGLIPTYKCAYFQINLCLQDYILLISSTIIITMTRLMIHVHAQNT